MTAEITRGDVLRALDADLLSVSVTFAAINAGNTGEALGSFTTLTQNLWVYAIWSEASIPQPYRLALRQQSGTDLRLAWAQDSLPANSLFSDQFPRGLYYSDINVANQFHLALTNRGSAQIPTGQVFVIRYRPAIISG